MPFKSSGTPICLAIAIGLVVSGCESTSLTEVWVDPQYKNKAIDSVIVVALSDDARRRAALEEEYVRRFENRGVRALSSRTFAPTKEEIDKESLKTKAEEMAFSYVIVTRLLGVEKDTVSVPPPGPYYTPPGHYQRLGRYYPRAYGYAYGGGYVTETTTVKLETNLYDVGTENLVWSAASKTFEPKSLQALVSELGEKIMGDLEQAGLVK